MDLELAPASDRRTLLGRRVARFRGAFAISLASHALLIVLVYALITLPTPARSTDAERRLVGNELVWLDAPAPGGGGGGGGNQMRTPSRRLETPGRDRVSIPVLRTADLRAPQDIPHEHEDREIALDLPVKPMDAGALMAAGVITDTMAAPTWSQGPGTGRGAGTGRGPGSGSGDGSGLGPGSRSGTGGIYGVGNGVIGPVLLRDVRPSYTTDAMQARIQGDVLVDAIVGPDGTVTEMRIARSLGSAYGLDDEALKAVRQWRFKPGTRFGQPVAVQVTIVVQFRLQ